MRLGRIAAVLLVGLVAGCDRGEHPGQLLKPAPEFTVNDGQRTVDLGKYRGRVVVLNFWATWCAPCIEELPSLEAMQAQVPEVQLIGVATDEDSGAYWNFLKQRPVRFLSVLDSAQKSNALYGSYRFPETYVIDKQGVVRRKFIGPQEWTSPEIEDYLKKLAAG
jgi:cytochrome c biogenesis protein CcmG, thiol:disulfide interchange protein DsbE